MAESKACEAPIAWGENKGLPATGTWAGHARHRKQGEQPCDPCAEASREKNRQYYAANRDDARTKRREYAAAHREEMTARGDEWRRNNREQSRRNQREHQRRRRAQILGSRSVRFTSQQLAARLSMWPGCWVCGGPADEVDHVKPLSKGGAHILANLRPICQHCNRTKLNRWPFEAVTKGAPGWGT